MNFVGKGHALLSERANKRAVACARAAFHCSAIVNAGWSRKLVGVSVGV